MFHGNTEEETLDDDGDNVFEDIDDSWKIDDECMEYIRSIVHDFRKEAVFLKRSIQCKELLDKIQTLPVFRCIWTSGQMEFNLFHAKEDGKNADNY